ncbi:hypothetical protein Barb7_02140 [Bacteroidales bacterium Barb7]|nr:hypothetical protein Barb7_02140 [Bacteroidales bacterium Barb7]
MNPRQKENIPTSVLSRNGTNRHHENLQKQSIYYPDYSLHEPDKIAVPNDPHPKKAVTSWNRFGDC